MDDSIVIAYAFEMAANPVDDRERVEVAQQLLSTVDDPDSLDDDERARLQAALNRSLADADAGRLHDADDVLAELHARHRP